MAEGEEPKTARSPGGEPDGNVSELAAFVRDRRDEIVAVWAGAARSKLASATACDHETLIDHVPPLLERIAEISLDLAGGETPAAPFDLAEKHAHTRLDASFGLGELVSEYALLRDTILRMWESSRMPPEQRGALPVLNLAIDQAIGASIDYYVRSRSRALQALDRLGSVAFESRSLEELLEKLLAAFLEATPAADTGMILLRESDRLVPRVAVGFQGRTNGQEVVRIGEGFAGTVAAERKARFLARAFEDPMVHSPAIKSLGLKALYGVPLLDRDEVLGVAHVGSVTTDSFSEEDQRLFRLLAVRAAAAIRQQTLRDEAERRAHDAATALARVRRLERLLSVHPDLFYLIDSEHRFAYASPSLLQLWKRSADEVIGRTFEELGYPGELVALHAHQLVRVFQGETVRGENPFTGPDGTERHYEYIFAPIPGESGTVEMAAGVTRDITERKRTEEMHTRVTEEARMAAKQREEFVAMVSHDLRNPLGAISLSTSLLSTMLQGPDPGVRKQLAVIQRSVDRMEHLIGDLLDVARIQAGVVDLDARAHGVDAILQEAVMLHEPLAREAGVDLVLEDVSGAGALSCDRERILQVLSNLLGNAVKACARGDRITVGAAGTSDHVRIFVSDTGPGISEDLRGRLFRAYESGAPQGGDGTGLGLYISKGIVEAHGGEIGFDTALGDGTTFWFRLPR